MLARLSGLPPKALPRTVGLVRTVGLTENRRAALAALFPWTPLGLDLLGIKDLEHDFGTIPARSFRSKDLFVKYLRMNELRARCELLASGCQPFEGNKRGVAGGGHALTVCAVIRGLLAALIPRRLSLRR